MSTFAMKGSGLCLILLVFAIAAPAFDCRGEPGDYCSPTALARGESPDVVYVADATRHAILTVDLARKEVRSQFALADSPSGLVALKTKPWILVTLGVPRGSIVGLDAATGKLLFSIPAGHTPCAPVLSPDEKTLFYCNRFNNEVRALDLRTLSDAWRAPVLREPVAAALTADGSKLVVTNLLPDGAATDRPFSAKASVLDAKSGKVLAHIPLPNGSTALLGVTISVDGRYAYVTHTVGRYQSPTKQVDYGWMNTNAFTVIDLSSLKTVATVLLDDPELGAANPWGIASTEDGTTLAVAHAGAHEVSLVDLRAVHAKLDRLSSGEAVSRVSTELACVQNDLSFLAGIRRRIALAGEGPRAVLTIGSRVVVAEYFGEKLAVIDPEASSPNIEIPLASPRAPDQIRRGEMLFSSATQCFQKWQSCASCHPDGRVDGFNWDLLNDGTGNPKNAKSMVYAHRTSPAMWTGVRESAESAVRAGFRWIQFTEISEEDAQAVDAYLCSLNPVPSPVALDPQLIDSIRSGEKLFESLDCSRCHSGEYFTDGRAHATESTTNERKPIVTPTLIENWRTGPYLHDGRAIDLCQVLRIHGDTKYLSAEDRRDLITYLFSL